MRKILLIMAVLATSACITKSTVPLGNGLVEINVSAPPIYGRANTKRYAFEEAAKATVEMGYDKFVIISNEGWNESTASGASHGSFGAQGNANSFSASGSSSGFFSTHRNPEATMIIKLFKYGEEGSEEAIDAHDVVKPSKPPSPGQG
jgi:hypothetical protein